MNFEKQTLDLIRKALEKMEEGNENLPPFEQKYDYKVMEEVLLETAERMQDNYPYFHPLYAGQMLKPPHPIARAAYMLSMWINPNNHALDGGRASSRMEKEAVREIAEMFGWETYLGHLTGGGTIANMEALWISGSLHPGKKVVASSMAHYVHSRLTKVLKIEFQAVPVNEKGQMDLESLKEILKKGDVGTVVATLGTTGSGSVDPLHRILELKNKYDFRIHVDSAYGGYFTLADNLDNETRKAYDALHQADSIVIDPHKHGLQPYGCGCILFQDPSVGRFYSHDSPYTYFTSDELHLGEISLECSRPGASAVALWATQKMLPLKMGGRFASGLSLCRKAALELYERFNRDERWLTLFPAELDIILWAPKAERASEISRLSGEFFEYAAQNNLHLALYKYPSALFEKLQPGVIIDEPEITVLRSCLMKPEHSDWLDSIWAIIEKWSTGWEDSP